MPEEPPALLLALAKDPNPLPMEGGAGLLGGCAKVPQIPAWVFSRSRSFIVLPPPVDAAGAGALPEAFSPNDHKSSKLELDFVAACPPGVGRVPPGLNVERAFGDMGVAAVAAPLVGGIPVPK